LGESIKLRSTPAEVISESRKGEIKANFQILTKNAPTRLFPGLGVPNCHPSILTVWGRQSSSYPDLT
jgi:hypothetical protein